MNEACPKAKYTNRNFKNKGTKGNDASTAKDVYWNSFGNGWSDEGRKRYCSLMLTINESRAFYNTSFDKRMKHYVDFLNSKKKNRSARSKKPTHSVFIPQILCHHWKRYYKTPKANKRRISISN